MKKKKVFLPINYVPYFGGKKYFFLLCEKIKYIKSRKKMFKVSPRDRRKFYYNIMQI